MPHPRESNESRSLALLPPGYRASGILLHVSSLPSSYGIGDLGPEAFAWIDRLAAAGQRWWQILPLGPTGQDNSPYDPLSTFAGNYLFISPDRLVDEGVLTEEQLRAEQAGAEQTGPIGSDPSRVDFPAVKRLKTALLAAAWQRFSGGGAEHLRESFQQFCDGQTHWLDDFAKFVAIKEQQTGEYFYNWPIPLARHEPEAVNQLAEQLAERIDFTRFVQFLFFRQWWRLKGYAQDAGVRLLGDLPFFVSHDSAEVWANPELFQLDETRHAKFVAGVPPDYFSETGQLWGNPVYNWDKLQSTEYRWWVRRLAALLQLVDGLRLDHFRAFSAAWHIPAWAPTAEQGEWIDCPGTDFFAVVRDTFGGLPFIAEDLGLITPDVRDLRDQFGMPGMRILQFAFDGDPDNIFLPQYYNENSAAFTGTHDNNTTRGWFQELDPNGQQNVRALLGQELSEEDVAGAMLQAVWESKSALAIAPLQDLLNLDGSARMNVPGVAGGNWGWRVSREQLEAAPFARLHQLTSACGRLDGRP
ncbi:4-alpha-glucanotransferase [Planctomycetaceae bacterium SH139]